MTIGLHLGNFAYPLNEIDGFKSYQLMTPKLSPHYVDVPPSRFA